MGFQIEKAICLCLDKRKDHWEDLENQCSLKGIPFEKYVVGNGKTLDPSEYDYIDDQDPDMVAWAYGNPTDGTPVNHYNAFLCHQRIVQKAKDQKLKNFLMLEDDAYFTRRYDSVISDVQHHLDSEEFKWDMLYFGWWIGHEGDEWNDGMEQAYAEEGFTAIARVFANIGGLHGGVINHTMYDTLLSLNPVGPIDMQLNHLYLHGPVKIDSYFMVPKIIHDKGLFSECDQNPNPRNKI